MAGYKFQLLARVRRIGHKEAYTVQEIRDHLPGGPLYLIQLGTDFATREWAEENELEDADKGPASKPVSEDPRVRRVVSAVQRLLGGDTSPPNNGSVTITA